MSSYHQVPQYIYTCINLSHSTGVAEWMGRGTS